MHKKFEINRTRIKGGCQSGRKVVTLNSKSDLPLGYLSKYFLTSNAHLENHQRAGNVNHLLHCVTTYQVKKNITSSTRKKIVQSELFVTMMARRQFRDRVTFCCVNSNY